jgi:hypothetical protein
MVRMQLTPDSTLELELEFLRERVRSPARLSLLLLLESAPKSWTVAEVQARTSLPRTEVVDALASLAADGLISECSVSGRWMYVQACAVDTGALERVFTAHRSGALDSFAILNAAAVRRIRQSARLLIGGGLRYQEDAAPRASGTNESGMHVRVRDAEEDAEPAPSEG